MEKCVSCGAPISGLTCEFCGAQNGVISSIGDELQAIDECLKSLQKLGQERIGLGALHALAKQQALINGASIPTHPESCSRLGAALLGYAADLHLADAARTKAEAISAYMVATWPSHDETKRFKTLVESAAAKSRTMMRGLLWVGGVSLAILILPPVFLLFSSSGDSSRPSKKTTEPGSRAGTTAESSAASGLRAAAPSMMPGFEGRYRLNNHPASDYLVVGGNSVTCAAYGCKDGKWGSATCTVNRVQVHPTIKDVLLINEAVCVVGDDPTCTRADCRFEGCSGHIKRDQNVARIACGQTVITDREWIWWKE